MRKSTFLVQQPKERFSPIHITVDPHLDYADMVIALLDGSQVDDGTAWEIGYFYRGKPEVAKIIGVRTDFRNAGESAGALVNAMVECACDRIAKSSEELLGIIFDIIED
jgi:nucleoside 2-deoxyribosyltransferase